MTLIVHHLNNSRSQRVLWALEELGLPYEIKHYQRDAVTNLARPSSKRSIRSASRRCLKMTARSSKNRGRSSSTCSTPMGRAGFSQHRAAKTRCAICNGCILPKAQR